MSYYYCERMNGENVSSLYKLLSKFSDIANSYVIRWTLRTKE